jgi:hypothetical protein
MTTKTPCVLMLFNKTLNAPMPWLRRGHTVIACDIQHPHKFHVTHEHGGTYITTNVPAGSDDLNVILKGFRVALVISFAPCTDMAVSGARHFKSKLAKNPNVFHEALGLAVLASTYGAPYMVENPVSKLATLWRRPNYIFNPCDYAGYCPEGPHPLYPDVLPPQDRYNKKTCLWTSGDFTMPPKKHMDPVDHAFHGHTKLGGKSLRTKNIRSATPRGFAEALCMANEHLLGPHGAYGVTLK